MEIERKFWLTELPTQYPELVHLETEQGYLVHRPFTVRIRRSRNVSTGACTYILCIKSSGTLSRHEVETALEPEQYEELAGLLDRPMVYKDYHAYRLPDGNTLECSIVDHGAFSFAEVEFETEEAARAWQPPECLGPELTYDRRFTMGSYYRTRQVPDLTGEDQAAGAGSGAEDKDQAAGAGSGAEDKD